MKKKYKVVVYERFRYEIEIDAENEDDARERVVLLAHFVEEMHKDLDFYQADIADIEEIK